jgi:hypothetical protein
MNKNATEDIEISDRIAQQPKQQTEYRIQQDCYRWFHNTYPNYRGLLFHVQQGAKNAIQGNRHKALGVFSGVADFVACTPTGQFLAIELKTPTGFQSQAQKKWEEQLRKAKGNYYICRSLTEFQEVVKIYFD